MKGSASHTQRDGASRETRAQRTEPQRHDDGRNLRRGVHSNGRFYQRSNEVLGMTPSKYRTGGAGTDIRFAVASVRSDRSSSLKANAAYVPFCSARILMP